MAIALSLEEYLNTRQVAFDTLRHAPTSTSLYTAAAARVPGDQLAKAVLLKDEEGYLLAVLPASHRIDLGVLHRRFGRLLGLATEAEVCQVMGDCGPGAVPALGQAYGLDTLVEPSLLAQSELYFEAGDHNQLVHLSGEQFRGLMGDAEEGAFSHHI